VTILVVGVSHRSAPLSVLERVALDADGVGKLVDDVSGAEFVSEVAVVSTCNRVEVYAEVDRFHGSVEVLSESLAARAGAAPEEVAPYLYVHYDEGAVAHLFSVAAGLDSMVVGESQILGQVREALRRGQDAGTVETSLNSVLQHALRVGKRAHAETGIDRAGQSLVSVALDEVGGDLAGRRVLVVGAGSMAGLAVATAARRGARDIVVANRSVDAARRLAETAAGSAVPLSGLATEIAAADVVISCTGATGLMVGRDALGARDAGRPLTILDLALPHDVDPAVAGLPGVTLVSIRDIAEHLTGADALDVDAVRRIVADEVAAHSTARRAAAVTPTVVALRSLATDVVDAELQRLDARLRELDPAVRSEIEQCVRRVAHKLVHAPTVRVKELAGDTATVSYADALAALFSLDPAAVDAVTRADNPVAQADNPVTQADPREGM
jgi:glutamyl-tRNA reductase